MSFRLLVFKRIRWALLSSSTGFTVRYLIPPINSENLLQLRQKSARKGRNLPPYSVLWNKTASGAGDGAHASNVPDCKIDPAAQKQ